MGAVFVSSATKKHPSLQNAGRCSNLCSFCWVIPQWHAHGGPCADISTSTCTTTTPSVISVTPTITETVWDFHTTYLEVVVTRTQTQLFNVDVINTSWARTTVTVAQTATSRNIAAVPDIDTTTTVTSIHTAVDITTEVVPVRSTQVFLNTETVFETRTQTSQIYSQITHSKCVLEVITVPKLVKEEITETAPHFITNYFTQTLTVTTVVTVQAPTIPVSNYY